MRFIELGLRDYGSQLKPPEVSEERFPKTPEEISLETLEEEPGSARRLKAGRNKKFIIKLKNDGLVLFKPRSGENTGLDPKQEQYKRERAAYLVDKFFDFSLVPTTVIRELNGEFGSAQKFLPDARLTYRGKLWGFSDEEVAKLFLFDYIIDNGDRNWRNFLSNDGRLVAIDHGKAFGPLLHSHYLASKRHIPTEIKSKIQELLSDPKQQKLFNDLLSGFFSQEELEALWTRLKNLEQIF